jgi:hypothetical protein
MQSLGGENKSFILNAADLTRMDKIELVFDHRAVNGNATKYGNPAVGAHLCMTDMIDQPVKQTKAVKDYQTLPANEFHTDDGTIC